MAGFGRGQPPLSRVACVMSALAGLVALAACVTPTVSTTTTDHVLRQYSRIEDHPQRALQTKAEVNGDRLTVSVKEQRRCSDVSYQMVRIEEHTERTAGPYAFYYGAEWTMAALGIGGGAALLAVAPSLSDEAPPPQGSGSTPGSARDGAYTGGGLLIAAGAIALAAAIVDAVKLKDTTRDVSVVTRAVNRTDPVPCGLSQPVRGRMVALDLGTPKRKVITKTGSGGVANFLLSPQLLTAGGSSPVQEVVVQVGDQQQKIDLRGTVALRRAEDHVQREQARRDKEAAQQAAKSKAEKEAREQRALSERLAGLNRLKAKMMKTPLKLYTADEREVGCSLPTSSCGYMDRPTTSTNGPHLVVAATRTHYGIVAADAPLPTSLAAIELWLPRKQMISASAYEKQQRAAARRERLQRLREEREERIEAAKERKQEAAERKQWTSRWNAIVGTMRGTMNVAIQIPRDDATRAFFLQAMGFGKPGGTVPYYDALKRLQRGATDDNILRIVGEAKAQYGSGQRRAYALHWALRIPLVGAEMLLRLHSEAP